MPNKLAVVTGASGGLGSELCKLIAADKVQLIMVDRNREKANAFAAELKAKYPGSVREVFAVDLASHSDIRRLTLEVSSKYPVIDFLFNNAGVLTETLQFSSHGNELHFEVNTLAPLQMIDGLRASLKNAKGAKIVSTSAGLAKDVKQLNWETLIKPVTFKKLYGPYVNSKQALNVLTAALASELAADNITIRTADPGPNKTGLTKGAGTPLWMRLFYWALPAPNKGAQKIYDAATLSKWGDASGIFISGGKILPLPPPLNDKKFGIDLLVKCRNRVVLSQAHQSGI